MRLFGLIGKPLTHSFSAQYFKKKFEQEKIEDCQYQLFPLSAIEDFPALLQQHPHLEGLNVTLPYKQQVIPFLSKHFIPTGLAACNCIRIREGRCEGYNTDWVGFEQSLLPLLDAKQQAAMVLGQGGAAQAVFYVLKKNGIPFTVVGRTKKPGVDTTFDELTGDQLRAHTIIINTTPLGTFPSIHEKPLLPYEAVGAGHLFFDLVYNPSETAFLKEGLLRGARIKNGLSMLEQQAEESWRIWNQ